MSPTREYTTSSHYMTKQPRVCGHCGSKAAMAIICEGDHNSVVDYGKAGGGAEDFHTNWQVLLCTNCNGVNVIQRSDSSLNEFPVGEDFNGEETWERIIDEVMLYPYDTAADSILSVIGVLPDWKPIRAAWNKANQRAESDPESAITAARALLETVCKKILERKGIPDNTDGDLIRLYRSAATQIGLLPDKSQEGYLNQILGACTGIAHGVSAMRNALGDAHGRGPDYRPPAPHYVRLAINASMTLAEFLIMAYQEEQPKPDDNEIPF